MAKRSFRRRARSAYYGARIRARKSRLSNSGLLSGVIAGVGAGVALSFAAPHVNKFLPQSVAGIPNTAISALILGAGAKMLLKSDPMKIPSSLIVLGGSMLGASLLGGQVSAAGNGGGFANDL